MLHPFYFQLCLYALSVLALVENGVLNSDVILFEVLKSHAISFLYMSMVVYFTIASDSQSDKSIIRSQAVQESVLKINYLAICLSLLPFVSAYEPNFQCLIMWLMPFLWVLVSFGCISWVS